MYFKLENKKFSLHVYFTQKTVDTEEQQHLISLMTKCTKVFEHFLTKKTNFQKHQTIECSTTICGLKKIRSLNKKYRGRPQKTDVLSFPLHDHRGKNPGFNFPIIDLGDIYICREEALIQAKKFNIPYPWEVVHLLIHGWLHLLGYDHEISKAEQKKMEALEHGLIEQLKMENNNA